MLIRTESKNDRDGVHSVNVSAFETTSEATLVEALRDEARPLISLVAEEVGEVIGHIMFSPVTLTGHPDLKTMGLAPMAVSPEHQRKGVGSALVRAGIEECRKLGFSAIVVLGHPDYYPRFGFVPSARFGIRSEYEVPEKVFMAMEINSGALKDKTGTVKYHETFGSI
jgi:putative acetyltransferase